MNVLVGDGQIKNRPSLYRDERLSAVPPRLGWLIKKSLMMHQRKSQPHSFGYKSTIPYAWITVAVPARATRFLSPCNSGGHSSPLFVQHLTCAALCTVWMVSTHPHH